MDNQEALEVSGNQRKPILPVLPAASRTFSDSYPAIKNGIWFYFILLIFEGGLRKWVLPGLAAPLLIIRDPVAIWLIVMAWKRGLLKPNFSLSATFAISIIGLVTALLYGHGNLLVGIYGVRTLLLHFVVIFIIGNVFNRDDVLKIGKAMLWITIPMTVLL